MTGRGDRVQRHHERPGLGLLRAEISGLRSLTSLWIVLKEAGDWGFGAWPVFLRGLRAQQVLMVWREGCLTSMQFLQ